VTYISDVCVMLIILLWSC